MINMKNKQKNDNKQLYYFEFDETEPKCSEITLLRPLLGLPKSGLISGVV